MPAQKKTSVKGGVSMPTLLPIAKRPISRQSNQLQDAQNMTITRAKRRGVDLSPLKNDNIKRSALGNLTNNVTLNKNNNNYYNEQKDNLGNKQEKKEIPFSKIKTTNKTITAATTTTSTITTNNIVKVNNENSMIPPPNGIVLRPTKILTRAAAKNAALAAAATSSSSSTVISSDVIKTQQKHHHHSSEIDVVEGKSTAKAKSQKTYDITTNSKPTGRRISNEFEKTEDSLYMSALEDMPSSDSLRLSGNFDPRRRSLQNSSINSSTTTNSTTTSTVKKSRTKSTEISAMSIDEEDEEEEDTNNRLIVPSPIKYPPVPNDVEDFDKENLNDPFQVSEYAMDIFEYLKQREALFPITDYMDKQKHLSKWMRSLLIDWMVEVQETFELNHETLYLAVKLVDLYLCKEIVIKDKLQLLGAGALFIACKYDERTPPLIDDFLYICDGAYVHDELIKMEMNILKTVDFDLGIPLSYRFLRRYARCAKVPMQTLTLARYILEFSLMDYATICLRDSHMACAVLFMALRMVGRENPWNKTLEYYSGYKLEEFAAIVPILNAGLHRKPRETIKTIRNKYSHKIFFEVAKLPLMSTEKLFETTGLSFNIKKE